MMIADEEGRRDVVMAGCLVLSSVVAVFALLRLSAFLNLRSFATPRQEQWGSVTWALAAMLFIVLPAYAGFRRRAHIPRWLTISAKGLFALFALQAASLLAFPLFGVLLPVLLPDEWVGVVSLATGVVGVYTFGAGAVDAARGHHRALAIGRWAGTAASAALVVFVVWGCLYFE